MPAAAGHDTRVGYLWEDDGFNSAPTDTTFKPFGANGTLTTLEGSNNAVRVFNPNSREAAEVIERNFSGSFSVSFELTNPWWLGAVISAPETSGGEAPYTHSYEGDMPRSIQLLQPTTKTETERVLSGAIVSSATIATAVQGGVDITLDGAYADEENRAITMETQPALVERPLASHHARVALDGTREGLIQDASLTIENNTDLIAELGSRTAVDYSPKIRQASLTYTDIVEDDSELERMYGAGSSIQPTVENAADITFEFDNGGTGEDANNLVINLYDALADSYGRSGIGDAAVDLQGTLTEMVPRIDVVAQNSVDVAL